MAILQTEAAFYRVGSPHANHGTRVAVMGARRIDRLRWSDEWVGLLEEVDEQTDEAEREDHEA
jgi:hypothetical protein